MCWSASASVGMVAIGGVAAGVSWARGDPKAIWLTLGYFTFMEGLQAAGYAVIDQCTDPANKALAWGSYLHIAFQPIAVNAFAMALAPVALAARDQRIVYGLAMLASAIMILQTLPITYLGACDPDSPLCGLVSCVISGDWHQGWTLPLNGLFNTWPNVSAFLTPFPAYFLAVFLMPVFYGAWRFALFHLALGPVAAYLLTSNPHEMPAIWCLFSIGIAIVALSPRVRYGLFGARRLPRVIPESLQAR